MMDVLVDVEGALPSAGPRVILLYAVDHQLPKLPGV